MANRQLLISHVGIAVKDLRKSVALFESILGRKTSGITSVPDQKVEVALFSASESQNDGGNIELVAPTDDSSPITRFLEKRGEGLHHVCVYVDDIESHLKELKKAGVPLIDESPRVGAEGHKIAFVHPSATGVLIELEERSRD